MRGAVVAIADSWWGRVLPAVFLVPQQSTMKLTIIHTGVLQGRRRSFCFGFTGHIFKSSVHSCSTLLEPLSVLAFVYKYFRGKRMQSCTRLVRK